MSYKLKCEGCGWTFSPKNGMPVKCPSCQRFFDRSKFVQPEEQVLIAPILVKRPKGVPNAAR